MNENKEKLNLDELNQVSGGSGTSNSRFQCPWCSFSSPTTSKEAKEIKEHFITSHPDKGSFAIAYH